MADDQDRNLKPESDVPGELLARENLAEPGDFQVAVDETEAEELSETTDPTSGVVTDAEQLTDAEQTARAAASTRPVRKAPPAVAAGPVKKDQATPRRQAARVAEKRHRTTPAQFVRESADELRKVVWPTATQLRQYFVVVLVFVLLIIAYVSAVDLLVGWGLLKIFG